MKNMSLYLFLAALFALQFFWGGCSSPDTGKKQKEKSTGQKFFPEIKNCSLRLDVVSAQREFPAGKEAGMTLRLTNAGRSPVVITEWMADEEDNILIYYAPYMGKGKRPSRKQWRCIRPEIKKPVKRASLQLNPYNSVIIDKKLSFISRMDPSVVPSAGSKIYIVGKLNLMSVSARTRPILIKVK